MDLVHCNLEPYVFLCGLAGYGPLNRVHLETWFTQKSGDQIFRIFFIQSQVLLLGRLVGAAKGGGLIFFWGGGSYLFIYFWGVSFFLSCGLQHVNHALQ